MLAFHVPSERTRSDLGLRTKPNVFLVRRGPIVLRLILDASLVLLDPTRARKKKHKQKHAVHVHHKHSRIILVLQPVPHAATVRTHHWGGRDAFHVILPRIFVFLRAMVWNVRVMGYVNTVLAFVNQIGLGQPAPKKFAKGSRRAVLRMP